MTTTRSIVTITLTPHLSPTVITTMSTIIPPPLQLPLPPPSTTNTTTTIFHLPISPLLLPTFALSTIPPFTYQYTFTVATLRFLHYSTTHLPPSLHYQYHIHHHSNTTTTTIVANPPTNITTTLPPPSSPSLGLAPPI